MLAYKCCFNQEKKLKGLVVYKPKVEISIRGLMLTVKNGRPFENMYLCYIADVENLMSMSDIYQFTAITKDMYEEDPRTFGVLVYKDSDGVIKFE